MEDSYTDLESDTGEIRLMSRRSHGLAHGTECSLAGGRRWSRQTNERAQSDLAFAPRPPSRPSARLIGAAGQQFPEQGARARPSLVLERSIGRLVPCIAHLILPCEKMLWRSDVVSRNPSSHFPSCRIRNRRDTITPVSHIAATPVRSSQHGAITTHANAAAFCEAH